MIVMVLSTLIGHCRHWDSEWSRKEVSGVMVEWEWEIVGERREKRRGGLRKKRGGLRVAEKKSTRKKDLEPPCSSPHIED